MVNNILSTPEKRFPNKYLIIILPVVGVLLVLGGYLIGQLSNKADQIDENKQLKVADVTSDGKSEKPTYKFSVPVMSPNNDLSLQLRFDEIGDENSLNLLINSFPNIHRPVTYLDRVEIENESILNWTDEKDQLERMFGYFKNYISWSPADNHFALLLPDKVVVYNYTSNPIVNDTYSPPRTKISLTKSDEFVINGDYDPYDYPVLLFSGNGKELYYSSKLGIRMFIPDEKIIETQAGYYPSSIYSIPNSPGIAYWVNGEEPGNNTIYFVTDFGTSFKKYKLTSDFSIDYPGEIILSPDRQKVCIGWGSSGSDGKILFDLTTGKQIRLGTGCIRWINNNEVVVYLSDSPSGGEAGNIIYYLVDLSTGNKTPLHNYYTGR